MMSRSSLYLLFFAIAFGAFAQTEANSVPAVVESSAAPSPVSFALLADQHQQKNEAIPVQKESPRDPLQQKKTPLANVLATAGTAAVLLVLGFFFMKQIKGFLPKRREPEDNKLTPKEEEELRKSIEEEIKKDEEVYFKGVDVTAETPRRVKRIKELFEANYQEWKRHYTRHEMVEEARRLDYFERLEKEKAERAKEDEEDEAWQRAKARNRN